MYNVVIPELEGQAFPFGVEILLICAPAFLGMIFDALFMDGKKGWGSRILVLLIFLGCSGGAATYISVVDDHSQTSDQALIDQAFKDQVGSTAPYLNALRDPFPEGSARSVTALPLSVKGSELDCVIRVVDHDGGKARLLVSCGKDVKSPLPTLQPAG